jgi:hypothetical protein
MRIFTSKASVLLAAILTVQHVSYGLPVTTSTTETGLQARIPPPRFGPKIEPDPIVPDPAPADGQPGSSTAGEPVPKFGEPSSGEPIDPAAPPPRFGGVDGSDPAVQAPTRATLGTEEDFQAMGLNKNRQVRAAFNNFKTWFDNNMALKTDKPWLFFTNLGTRAFSEDAVVTKFQQEVQQGLHPFDAADTDTRITHIGEVMPLRSLPEAIPGPGAPEGFAKLWYDMLISLAAGRMGAVTGGRMRLVMPKGGPFDPPNKFWGDFELFGLTAPGTRVTEIWRYDADDFNAPPVRVWTPADGQIGRMPDFSKEPQSEGEEIIDLDAVEM